MTEPIDPVTTALTGKLPFYLLLAAALTFPIALAVVRLYARAVRRSMRQAHGGPVTAPQRGPDSLPQAGDVATPAATLYDISERTAGSDATLFKQLVSEPRRAALVYAAAGLAYGGVMAASQLLSDGLEILPIRFLFLAWVFAWPVVLTIGIVAAMTRRAKVTAGAGYFLVLIAIGAVGMSRSPDLSWAQIILAWILYNLAPTVLLLMFLSRRIRAVGPLILTFMFLALIGSDVALSMVGSQGRLLSAILRLTSPIGLGGTGTFVAIIVVGFLMFTVVGWAALLWIGRRYQAKKISDESVTVDAIWMLFTMVHSINLVFGRPIWTLAAVVAFGAYNAVARIGFAWLRRAKQGVRNPPTLLVLRSFSIGSDSERLFDDIGRHWRRVGSMQMIAGIDLVSRTVEPHEFLDFVSGRLSRRFIDGEESLDLRMHERDVAADRDLRFRVNEFFCYDDTWKMVLSRLVHESDAVIMDLRGFSRQNAGCVFELHELVRLVPLTRVVFVTDRRTDEVLLAQALGAGRIGIFRLGAMSADRLRQLLHAIATAAAAAATATESAPPVDVASA
jgi:hypothetical protein